MHLHTAEKINIWMQLLGFDRDEKDKGVEALLTRTGFVPNSVCGLLYHPDFVHLHRGMDHEYTLFQDNCAYLGAPGNRERKRQDWTNYDLRTLVQELKKQGIAFYASIFGSYLKDKFHQEWLSDHPELLSCRRNGRGSLMCLKRFRDGTYYEDFFAQKLVQTLVDYDMAGVHLADSFCPTSLLYLSDYSADMVEQFFAYLGEALPQALADTMGDDETAAVNARADYIWENQREQWIRFYQWRWAGFFKKICAAVHRVGKKVWVLGVYCTDPFETNYTYGFDCKAVLDAGVDCITANILPTSVSMNKIGYPYYFHRIHMDLPLICAQAGEHSVVSMVNVQDASEEWSVLEHRPVQLERDLYTITAWQSKTASGYTRAAKGLMICLGDGIDPYHWQFLKSRMDAGLDVKVQKVWSPMILWSDTAHHNMLPAYIRNRRTTTHKQSFEVFGQGTPFGGTVRTEQLDDFDGVLFAPNFDLLAPEEQEKLLALEIPFVGTAPKSYDLTHLSCTVCFEDAFSDEPLQAFVCHATLPEKTREEICLLNGEEDLSPSTADEPEPQVTALYAQLPFSKLSRGFVKAIGLALRSLMQARFPVISSVPMLAVQLENGKDRLYLYNTQEDQYHRAMVESSGEFQSAQVVSHYPVQPPRFVPEESTGHSFNYDRAPTSGKKFQVKLAPGGVTVIDITK